MTSSSRPGAGAGGAAGDRPDLGVRGCHGPARRAAKLPADGRARPADQPLQPPAFPRGTRADARRRPAVGEGVGAAGHRPRRLQAGQRPLLATRPATRCWCALAAAVGRWCAQRDVLPDGGDEFAILVPSAAAPELAELARRVTPASPACASLRRRRAVAVTASIGIAFSPSRGRQPRAGGGADRAMYGRRPRAATAGLCPPKASAQSLVGPSTPRRARIWARFRWLHDRAGGFNSEVIHGTDGQLCEARPRG